MLHGLIASITNAPWSVIVTLNDSEVTSPNVTFLASCISVPLMRTVSPPTTEPVAGSLLDIAGGGGDGGAAWGERGLFAGGGVRACVRTGVWSAPRLSV